MGHCVDLLFSAPLPESKETGFGDHQGKRSPPCSSPPNHMNPDSKAGGARMVVQDNPQQTNNLPHKGSNMLNDGTLRTTTENP